MVISYIDGGLGNQMFQYAAGLALARRLNTEYILDLRNFLTDPLRTFDLPNFKVSVNEAPQEILTRCHPRRRHNLVDKILHPISHIELYREPHFHYDPKFWRRRTPTYLQGYFQSERYFAMIADEVRAHFQMLAPMNAESLRLSQLMKQSQSVSLHIRRSDYVSNPTANAYHGLAPLEYYQKALMVLEQERGPLNIFVFSDDAAWSQANLKTKHPVTFVTHNTKNFEDLHLMSHCHDHIIANSSFSWWGAWLNPNPQKKVVAPLKWFANSENDTKDLTPPDWLRL